MFPFGSAARYWVRKWTSLHTGWWCAHKSTTMINCCFFSYFYFREGWATRPAAGGRAAPQWGGEEERGECHANKPIIEGYWAVPVNLRPSSHGQTEADTNKWDSSFSSRFFSRRAHRPSPGSTFFVGPCNKILRTFFFFNGFNLREIILEVGLSWSCQCFIYLRSSEFYFTSSSKVQQDLFSLQNPKNSSHGNGSCGDIRVAGELSSSCRLKRKTELLFTLSSAKCKV